MIYSIPSYLVWTSLLRPLLYFKPEWFYMIEGILYSWLLHFVAFWTWNAGCKRKLQITANLLANCCHHIQLFSYLFAYFIDSFSIFI